MFMTVKFIFQDFRFLAMKEISAKDFPKNNKHKPIA
jgi:hypothetical protein